MKMIKRKELIAVALSALLVACGGEASRVGPPPSEDGRVQDVSEIDYRAEEPVVPEFIEGSVGKPLSSLGAEVVTDCIGGIDAFQVRLEGESSGFRVAGWSWNKRRASSFDSVVLVDAKERIVGAAEGSTSRPDVPAALPDTVTSDMVGWVGTAIVDGGVVMAYGYEPNESSLCLLGQLRAG